MSMPGLKFFRLWERESKNGRRYFSGYIGGLNVVVFKDEEAAPRPGVIAEWQAFANEAKPRPQASAGSPPRAPGHEARKPAAQPESADGRPFDDGLADLWWEPDR